MLIQLLFDDDDDVPDAPLPASEHKPVVRAYQPEHTSP
jgi:hypothetical protein